MGRYRRLRDMREDHDLTQAQVAGFLDMHPIQYGRYERGVRELPAGVLIRLARLYGTSTDYLLGLTEDASPPAGRTAPADGTGGTDRR